MKLAGIGRAIARVRRFHSDAHRRFVPSAIEDALQVDHIQRLRDGSCLVFRSGRTSRPTMLFCGRENFRANGTNVLTRAFDDFGFNVIEHQSPYEVVAREGPADLLARIAPDGIAQRVESLCHALDRLPQPPRLVVGHSAGARVASLVATQRDVQGLVLFGYPFRHPERDDEPERYAHLATLDVPCLILQGENDEYGGKGLAGKYPLSPKVRLAFIPDNNHEFLMFDQARGRVFEAISRFLAGPASVSR